MKKRLLLYTTLLLAVFSAFSCKKDEQTTEIKPSIYGLTFDLATFGRPGESFTVEPYGVYVTEGEGIVSYQYKWKVNSDPYSDPMDTFTFTAEEVGNYTITCQVSDPDDNYYTGTFSKTTPTSPPTRSAAITPGTRPWRPARRAGAFRPTRNGPPWAPKPLPCCATPT